MHLKDRKFRRKIISGYKASNFRTNFQSKKSVIDKTTILSLIAILISFGTLFYTIFRDQKLDSEIVNIEKTSHGICDEFNYRSAELTSGKNPLIPTYYEFIISNNSNMNVSIIQQKIFGLSEDGGYVHYSKLQGNSYFNGEQSSYPITLNAGESVVLKTIVNYYVPTDIIALLDKKYSANEIIKADDLQEYLALNKKDIYNNNITVKVYSDGRKSIGRPLDSKFPKYDLILRTSKNNVFKSEFYEMDMSDYKIQ